MAGIEQVRRIQTNVGTILKVCKWVLNNSAKFLHDSVYCSIFISHVKSVSPGFKCLEPQWNGSDHNTTA